MTSLISLVVAGSTLGGAVLAVHKRRQKRARLLKKLEGREIAPQGDKKSLDIYRYWRMLRTYFSVLDQRYQSLIKSRVDPLLLGKVHEQQLQTLAEGTIREVSPREKSVNRRLMLGVGSLGLLATTPLLGWPALAGVMGIGLYSIKPAIQESWRLVVSERRFSLLHLMVLYISFLWFSGYYVVGSIGLLFINLNRKVELLVQNITRHKITHLLGEQPQSVWVLVDGSEVEIPFSQLKVNDTLVLNAGQPVPVDGVVLQGSASIDQQRLTGESQPVEKTVGDAVLAATLVLGGRLEVCVEKTGQETAAAKIGEVLNRTVEHQEVRVSDQFKALEGTRWPMLAGGALGWALSGPTTAVALMGCNYLMSMIPLRLLTLLNGLKAGAEQGVLIKDGRALEHCPQVDTIVFDKTGTLTLKQPEVAAIHCVPEFTESDVLTYAAAAEQHQSHPIAQAVLTEAKIRGVSFPDLEDAHYQLGLGLTATVDGEVVNIGSQRFLEGEGYEFPDSLQVVQTLAAEKGNALIFISVASQVIGAIELASALREEAHEVINWFKQQGLKLYIISGDQEAPTRTIASELQMDGYFANTLPEQKAVRIQELQAQGRKVCFIGDGINDAIALRQAELSISLKGATTVATDAAQVVLMENNLKQLMLLWQLASGFEHSLKTNKRLAGQFSMAAVMGVAILPFKFWVVELLWGSQALTGFKVANRSLLHKPKKPLLPKK